MTGKRMVGFTIVAFIASIAAIITSFTLLKEDVLSTANTLYYYFPKEFGVITAVTEDGSIRMGIFITVVQIIAAAVASRKEFQPAFRWTALVLIALSTPFDVWTDIVHRSREFTGNMPVAITTTIAFYTFGSEVVQTLGWVVALTTWRIAIREVMWIAARGWAGVVSISSEWRLLKSRASNQEQRDVANSYSGQVQPANTYRQPPVQTPLSRPASSPRPVYPSRPSGFTGQTGYGRRPEPTYHPIGPAQRVQDDDGDDGDDK